MDAGSVSAAIRRSRPPQAGQRVTSRAKTRANNAAQEIRGGPVDAASEAPGVGRPGARAGGGYDLAAMAGIGRENAVIAQQVETGRWDEGG